MNNLLVCVIPASYPLTSPRRSRLPPRLGVEVIVTGDTGNMVSDTNVRGGQCHCAAVRFEATLSDGFNSIRRCTCSYCRMRGAVVVMAEMGGIKLLQGED